MHNSTIQGQLDFGIELMVIFVLLLAAAFKSGKIAGNMPGMRMPGFGMPPGMPPMSKRFFC